MNNPCININNVSMTAPENQGKLLDPPQQEQPKISLAVARSDEEPKLEPFTAEDRKLYLFLTASLIIQALLNIISSIVMRSDDSYCSKLIDNYQVLVALSAVFLIIMCLVIAFIRVFRRKTYAIISTILFFSIESVLFGLVACYFETQYVRFLNILIAIDLSSAFIYFSLIIKERVSLMQSIPFVLIANVVGYLVAFFSTEIEMYESLGSLLAGINFNFFYIWLFKMIHLKKIHPGLDIFRYKMILPVLIQIDLVFLTFFSIFFIGV